MMRRMIADADLYILPISVLTEKLYLTFFWFQNFLKRVTKQREEEQMSGMALPGVFKGSTGVYHQAGTNGAPPQQNGRHTLNGAQSSVSTSNSLGNDNPRQAVITPNSNIQ